MPSLLWKCMINNLRVLLYVGQDFTCDCVVYYSHEWGIKSDEEKWLYVKKGAPINCWRPPASRFSSPFFIKLFFLYSPYEEPASAFFYCCHCNALIYLYPFAKLYSYFLLLLLYLMTHSSLSLSATHDISYNRCSFYHTPLNSTSLTCVNVFYFCLLWKIIINDTRYSPVYYRAFNCIFIAY